MTDLSKLVDQQLRLTELKKGLEQTGQAPTPVKVDNVRYGPCLFFSRECGSAGDEIAGRVGERLHWHVFNREIVEQIAERAHVRSQLVESVDEHVRSRWRRLFQASAPEALKPEEYLMHLHEIVLSLAHHGYVIMVGRGVQFLLPPQCALRVRVVESFSSRVRRIAAIRQLSTEDATQFVHKREADRMEFIRKVFRQDTTSPLNYDLVINADLMGVDQATEVVLAALQSKLGVRADPAPCAMLSIL